MKYTDITQHEIEALKHDFNQGKSFDYNKKLIFEINKNSALNGFKGYFTANLAGDDFSTEFVKENSSCNHFYFPLREKTLVVLKEQKLTVTIEKKKHEYNFLYKFV